MESTLMESLKREDRIILNLRRLYEQFGYTHYKMNKFEEYDLYVANKDFLADSSIITFTDTNGKLMALKPDVTLSIVKNYLPVPDTVQKVYYNENIYRPAKSTHIYKETMQMGLECIGALDTYHISEVVVLAAKSLETLSDHYILDLSHVGVIRGFLEALSLRPSQETKFLTLLKEKNAHGIRQLLDDLGIGGNLQEKAITLASSYGSMEIVIPVLQDLIMNKTMARAVEELSLICNILMSQGLRNIHLDFSIEGDMAYYNGVLFRGYIAGIPSSVLSGGQYDELTEKMGKRAGALGFAINMALLESYEAASEDYDVDVLLLYDSDGLDSSTLMAAVSALIEKGHTVQTQRQAPPKLKYKKLMKFQDGEVKEFESVDTDH